MKKTGSFYLGMGMGIAAATSVAMLMTPKKKNEVRKTVQSAEQAVHSTARKMGM